MLGYPPVERQAQEPNWTHQEAVDLIAIWGGAGDIEVQQQFS